jgi:hypothetical protein
LDPVMAKSFNSLMHFLNERDRIIKDSTLTSVIREEMLRGLSAEVEELYLDFSLPGPLVIELKNNGTAEPVSHRNLDNYLEVTCLLCSLIWYKFHIYLLYLVVFLLDIGRRSEWHHASFERRFR